MGNDRELVRPVQASDDPAVSRSVRYGGREPSADRWPHGYQVGSWQGDGTLLWLAVQIRSRNSKGVWRPEAESGLCWVRDRDHAFRFSTTAAAVQAAALDAGVVQAVIVHSSEGTPPAPGKAVPQ